MEKEDYARLEEFREAIAKFTASREAFKNIVEAHQKHDVERFRELLKRLELSPPMCQIVCWFICWIEYRIRCGRICTVLCR
jgi:hypothetical protein